MFSIMWYLGALAVALVVSVESHTYNHTYETRAICKYTTGKWSRIPPESAR